MAKVVVCGTFKGGVGKSSLVTALSQKKATEGHKVLIIDLCANSNIATKFGYDRESVSGTLKDVFEKSKTFMEVIHEAEENIDFIPSAEDIHRSVEYAKEEEPLFQFALKQLIEAYADRLGYEYVMIDTHPKNDDLFKWAALAADTMFIPTHPEDTTEEAANRTLDVCLKIKRHNPSMEIFLVPSIVESVTEGNLFPEEVRKIHAHYESLGVPVTGAVRFTRTLRKKKHAGINYYRSDNPFIRRVADDYAKISTLI